MAKVSRTKSARSSAAARKKGGKAGQRAARGSGQVANLASTDPQHAARGVDRQDRAASSDHLLQGYIDEASSSRITGWVWNPQQPDSPITLDLADGDTRLARVTGDTPSRYRWEKSCCPLLEMSCICAAPRPAWKYRAHRSSSSAAEWRRRARSSASRTYRHRRLINSSSIPLTKPP